MAIKRRCACNCGLSFLCHKGSTKRFLPHHNLNILDRSRFRHLKVDITHWIPLPPIPIYGLDWQKKPETVVSPLGFRYFKGSDKLAKEFAKIGDKRNPSK
jgi:hypothetical protein